MAIFSGVVGLYIVGIIVVSAVVQRTRTWLRLRHIPGPPIAGLLEWWHYKHTMEGQMHLDTAGACEKYGIYECEIPLP